MERFDIPTVLAVVAHTALLTGVLGSLAALLTPRHLPSRRGRWWRAATAGFAIAGVLGILSIGVVFLMLSGGTALAALRADAVAARGGTRGAREP